MEISSNRRAALGKERRMKITENTRVAELMEKYPWLMDEVAARSSRARRLLALPGAKLLLKRATVADVARKTGADAGELLRELAEMIETHGK